MLFVEDPEPFDAIAEFGMGFHFARRVGQHEEHFIVFNAMLALSADEIGNTTNILSIKIEFDGSGEPVLLFDVMEDRARLLGRLPRALRARLVSSQDRDALDKFLRSAGLPEYRTFGREHRHRVHGSPPWAGASKAGDRFRRYSTFRNDRRILTTGEVLPSTYVTSESDTACVPNALAATGRYALPSLAPPVHVFEINPPPGTPLLFGTALPNFGQAGGGAEMEFNIRLPPGSAVYRGTIAEW